MKKIKSETVYSNKWISVSRDNLIFPDGSTGEYGVVHHRSKSVVVLVEKEDQLLLVNAYRYVTGSASLELPAGVIEEGETPIGAACREVWEETGYVVDNCVEMFSYYPSNGTSDQIICAVKGKYKDGDAAPDHYEISDTVWMTVEDVLGAIVENKITDGPTMTAFLYFYITQ